MPDIKMVLGRDFFDVSVTVIGGEREPPIDATGDFLAGRACTLLDICGGDIGVIAWVSLPFAPGQTAELPMNWRHLLPG